MKYYKNIGYDKNPWKLGNGDFQDILGMEVEPEFIIYTPDIECYCNNEDDIQDIINDWILENGSYECYTKLQDKKIGWI